MKPTGSLVLRLVPAILATALALELEGRSVDVEFERISTDQGLSNGAVESVLEDHRGFLWVATRGGLNQYDGYSFHALTHRSREAISLANNYVYAIAEDGDGMLWIGTFQGLDRFDRSTNRFTHLRHDPASPASLSDDHINSLCYDSAGGLWVGTRRGLDKLDPSTLEVTRYSRDSGDPGHVTVIHEAGTGHLWIGTNRDGLYKLDRATDSFALYPNDPAAPDISEYGRVRALHEDRSGTLWIGTSAGLAKLDPRIGRWERLEIETSGSQAMSQLDIRALYMDESDRLWIGTEFDGLYILDTTTGDAGHYRHGPENPRSLSSNRITTIYEDGSGVIWIGTGGGGLNKHVRERASFEHYESDRQDPASSLINDQVRAIYTDGSGALWVGTEGGLSRFDAAVIPPDPPGGAAAPPGGSGGITAGRIAVHYQYDEQDPNSLSSDRVSALAGDDRGLWIGTQGGGLGRLDLETGRLDHYRADPRGRTGALSHDTVTALFVDRSGVLWVGTQGGLDAFHDFDPPFVNYRHDPADPDSLSNNLVTAIYEDDAGALWVGTYVGLNELDRESGRFRRFTRRPDDPGSLTDSRIWSIHGDSAGRIWVGTSGGLNLLEAERKRFLRFPRKDPEKNVIYGILSDSRGHLWISSSGGLSDFDSASGTFIDFGTEDGLGDREFNPGAYHRSASGEMFFGGSGGFSRFRPERVRKDLRPPPVVLTAFKKFNRDVDFPSLISEVEEIRISYRDNFIAFEFAALDFVDPAKNRYAYRLERFDDWIDIGTRRRETFANLPGGEYTLRVKAANSSGVWNEEGLSVNLVVVPPFWQTWWFRVSAAVMVSAVILTIYRVKTRAIEARSRRFEEVNVVLNAEIEQRTRTEAEKQQVISELEARNAEMERFIYTVSHDLKSPLFTIQGFVGMVEKDAIAGNHERLRQDVDRIRGAATTMSTLLHELLELSRIGRVVNEPEKVSLTELAHEALRLVEGRVRECGAHVNVADGLPAVIVDRPRLLEVFQNLIDNAVKFMDDQPAPRIDVGCRRDGAEAVVFVRDNGIGIEPPYQDKVFGLFERLDPENSEGTGVGLAIVKRVVELHGGRIWVESEGLGHGCTFCFTLPDRRG